jgi:hypothetical protein
MILAISLTVGCQVSNEKKPDVLIIGSSELGKIKDFAIRHFHNELALPGESKDTQAFLLIRGLEDLLRKEGYEVNFHVKSIKENSHDQMPLDDIG